MTLEPLSNQNLYHNCIPILQSRLPFFIEELVICCCFITDFCRALNFSGSFHKTAVVIFVRLQITPLGSFGKNVNRLCFPPFLLEGRGLRRGVSGGFYRSLPDDLESLSTKPSVNSSDPLRHVSQSITRCRLLHSVTQSRTSACFR